MMWINSFLKKKKVDDRISAKARRAITNIAIIASLGFFCLLDVLFILVCYTDIMDSYVEQFAVINGSNTYTKQNYAIEDTADSYHLSIFGDSFFYNTKIKNTVIDIKIMNSLRNEIEIESSDNVLSQIEFAHYESSVSIDFKKEAFNLIDTGMDTSYDYDYGLIVKTKKLKISVYAPINGVSVFPKVHINAELVACENTYLDFNEVKGSISGIDAQKVKLTTSYADLKLQGKCNYLELYLFHGAHINAKNFAYEDIYEYSIISSTFFAITYFDSNKLMYHINGGAFGTIISIFVLMPVFIIICCSISFIKRTRIKRKINANSEKLTI